MDPVTSSILAVFIEKTLSKAAELLTDNVPKKPSRVSPTGRWHSTWIVQEPPRHHPKKVEDTIVLKVGRNGKVRGSGDNPYYGKFRLTGKDSPYAITLTYAGEGSSSNRPGVCLLTKTHDADRMQGVWLQLGPRVPLVGGTVTMRRKV